MFDLSTLPSGAVITSATFHLTVESSQAFSPRPIGLGIGGLVSVGPTLTLADFMAIPTFFGGTGPLPDNFPVIDPMAFSFDVTALVKHSGPDVGFILSAGNTVITFGLQAPPGLAPSLDITFAVSVPGPASALMVALAMVGLAVRRTRY